jgi:hypothetical protein
MANKKKPARTAASDATDADKPKFTPVRFPTELVEKSLPFCRSRYMTFKAFAIEALVEYLAAQAEMARKASDPPS